MNAVASDDAQVRKILGLLRRVEAWFEETDDDDDDFEDAAEVPKTLDDDASYAIELARLVPSRVKVLGVLLHRSPVSNLVPLGAISGTDDASAHAMFVRIGIAGVAQAARLHPSSELARDLATYLPLLWEGYVSGRAAWADDLVASLREGASLLDETSDDAEYDWEFCDHPGKVAVKWGARLVRSTTMASAAYATTQLFEALREWFQSLDLDGVVARALESLTGAVSRPELDPIPRTIDEEPLSSDYAAAVPVIDRLPLDAPLVIGADPASDLGTRMLLSTELAACGVQFPDDEPLNDTIDGVHADIDGEAWGLVSREDEA